MPAPRYFRIEQHDDTLIFCAVDAIGGLVEDEARVEWDALLEQLSEQGAKNAVMDLGALDYFGSIVLELMVVLWKRVSAQGGKLAVCNVSEVGLEILKTAKFDTIWPIVTTREEAIEAIG
ncbi:MAG: STAS domain-containing protein [Pirellulaceae bacterium]